MFSVEGEWVVDTAVFDIDPNLVTCDCVLREILPYSGPVSRREVRKKGADSHITRGKIDKEQYVNCVPLGFQGDVISIKSINNVAFSEEGDSGAMVWLGLVDSGEPLGVIIARRRIVGNRERTLVARLDVTLRALRNRLASRPNLRLMTFKKNPNCRKFNDFQTINIQRANENHA